MFAVSASGQAWLLMPDGQFHANRSLEGKIKSEPILKGDCTILKIRIWSFQIKNRFLPAIVVQILQQF